MEATSNPDLSLILPRIALDLVAIGYLLFGLFYRVTKRADLVQVYLACNLGLFSVLTVLSFSPLSSAIGFALFGVLSIIRLRSFEYTHEQIGYFFISLSIALICAIDLSTLSLPILLVGTLLLAMTFVELLGNRAGSTSVELTIDQVITNEEQLKQHVSTIIDASVLKCKVMTINSLQETMGLQVTYRKAK